MESILTKHTLSKTASITKKCPYYNKESILRNNDNIKSLYCGIGIYKHFCNFVEWLYCLYIFGENSGIVENIRPRYAYKGDDIKRLKLSDFVVMMAMPHQRFLVIPVSLC